MSPTNAPKNEHENPNEPARGRRLPLWLAIMAVLLTAFAGAAGAAETPAAQEANTAPAAQASPDPLTGYPKNVVRAIKDGTTLEQIDLRETAIVDLRPLKTLRPKELYLNFCEHLTDFAPLAELTTLEYIEMNDAMADLTPLR